MGKVVCSINDVGEIEHTHVNLKNQKRERQQVFQAEIQIVLCYMKKARSVYNRKEGGK